MTSPPGGRLSAEQLRPAALDQMVGQVAAVARLQRLAEAVRSGRLVPPHLLFHGPPGTGKTTAARAFGRAVLGEDWENSFHELGALDDRGATLLRTRLLPGALRPPSRGAPCRMFFFDEIEGLSPDALHTLRPALENATGSSVFILACNELERVPAPIQSRCLVLEFSAVAPDELRRLLHAALAGLGRSLPEPVLAAIVAEARGTPRTAVRLLVEALAAPEPMPVPLAAGASY